mmetsp:Transcript_9045/g.21600  ORF Transcript_9045/g.21600 Transcript_9045/m.21600 type:complete len:269 (-) Transcript_9045:63-869(-)
MVNICPSASRASIEHAAAIQAPLLSSNRDSNWTDSSKSRRQSVSIVGFHFNITPNLHCGLVVLARSVGCRVWIIRRCCNSVVPGVVERQLLDRPLTSTSAPAMGWVGSATNVGLWRELDQLAGRNGVRRLDTLCRCESPTRPALTLILHGGQHILAAPVDGVRQGFRAQCLQCGLLLWHAARQSFVVSAHTGELFLGEVCHRIDSHVPRLLPCIILFVVCYDGGQIPLEDVPTHSGVQPIVLLAKLFLVLFKSVSSVVAGGPPDHGAD